MTRRRWIADEVCGDRAFLIGANAHHLVRVLRAQVGQQFEISTPDGPRMGTIAEIEPERVTFALGEVSKKRAAHSAEIHLYLSVFKFDRFEWAIEKCTELGASSIHPVIARRTETHLTAAAKKRVERWRRIAHEAAQQSRRDHAPEIRDPEKLDRAIQDAPGKRIVLAETEIEHALSSLVGGCDAMSLAIGPEGGWTESDLKVFASAGWIQASLGPTILRAETAAIAALAIAKARAEIDSSPR